MYDDILRHRKPPAIRDELRESFAHAEAAAALPKLLPKGEYMATLKSIKVDHNKNDNLRAVLTFEVTDGEFVGKKVWLDLYLTLHASEQSVKVLKKLGIESEDDLLKPVPKGIICSLQVVVETGDSGKQWNKITEFKVIEFRGDEPDPFAPQDEGGAA